MQFMFTFSFKRVRERIEAGNCFPTEEAATKAAQAIQETLKNL